MFNKVTLIGSAVPIEFFWNASGERVAVLSLTSTEKFRTIHSPDMQSAQTLHRVVVIGSRAEMLRRRMQHPRPLLIEGQLRDGVEFMDGQLRTGAVICVTPSNGTIRFLDEIDEFVTGEAMQQDALPPAQRAVRQNRIAS